MSDPQRRRRRLAMRLDDLNDNEVIVVDDFVAAILAPIEAEDFPESWLTSDDWVQAFIARLRAHHALSEEPLSTTQFEAAFNAACRQAGWIVTAAEGATNRFFDTTIARRGQSVRLSLKASSAKDMKRESVHISKLTEAAWIQDTRIQAERRHRLIALFDEYRHSTDAIIMLRGFQEGDSVLYELLEIPTDLFSTVAKLSVAEAQDATIAMPPDAIVPSWKIRIDRSDAKITLSGIKLYVCSVHGRWRLQGSGE